MAFQNVMAGVFTKYVNPFIGTGPVENSLSGNTYPGATMPFGMVQLSPDTQDSPDWDNASGYNYNHNTIYGFTHTRLSGTGACDLLDVLFLPWGGEKQDKPVAHFSHQNEQARPGYYMVTFDESGISAELTATTRVGIHRYQFGENQHQRLFVDLYHSAPKGSWDRRIIQSQLRIVSPTVIEGYRVITGWAKLRKVYFHVELSKPIVSHLLSDGGRKEENATVVNGRDVKGWLDFDASAGGELLCKVAISAVSIENARENMQAEAADWNFESYCDKADKAWDKILGRIEVEGENEKKEIFYTALYHAFLQPNTLSDVNGEYPSTDYSVKRMPKGKNYYTTFSLWDTFRAVHPLYTVIAPDENSDFVESCLLHFDSYGYLPIWGLWGQDNYCMIGNHAVPVLVDACLKGTLKGIDKKRVLDAVVQSSITSHPGLNVEAWEKYGYMPENVQSQSVSITLEQAYDDWCVAQLAKHLGEDDIYERFLRRSEFWRNIYNPSNRFFQAKDDKGEWIMPFDPLVYGANGGNPYTEGNAWQWSWFVPHNIEGLIEMHGGKKAFKERLDEFFTLEGQSGELNSNASGFVGQYIHGNEPGHHAAYLYNYAGSPESAQKYIAHIVREMYNTSSSGYAGNDDCGQMSAWYVFSAMGFYPVNPASGKFVLGTPQFASVTLHLPNGKDFKITASGLRSDRYRVAKTLLSGRKVTTPEITYDDIMQGGTLEFVMKKGAAE